MIKRRTVIPVLLHGEIIKENAAGQHLVVIKATGADGIAFWTDSQSLLYSGGRGLASIDDVISRLESWEGHTMTDAEAWHLRQVIGDIRSLPRFVPLDMEEMKY